MECLYRRPEDSFSTRATRTLALGAVPGEVLIQGVSRDISQSPTLVLSDSFQCVPDLWSYPDREVRSSLSLTGHRRSSPMSGDRFFGDLLSQRFGQTSPISGSYLFLIQIDVRPDGAETSRVESLTSHSGYLRVR